MRWKGGIPIKSEIKNTLMDLGVDSSRIGFEYLSDAIEIVLSHAGASNLSLDREVYDKIAVKYSVSIAGVKSGIDYAMPKKGITTPGLAMLEVGKRLGYPANEIPVKCSVPWTPEQDKIILDNPGWSINTLLAMPEFKGKGSKSVARRKKALFGKATELRPRKTHFENAKNERGLPRPPLPVSGVTLGQILKIHGKRCEVIYIHPENLFYQVRFKNGIRETINRHEYGQTPFISWLSKNF